MRKLSQRYVVRARLRLETPLHVGGATGDLRSDLPLAEDGQGRCYIPGTSLAGALRSVLPRRVGNPKNPTRRDTYPWGPMPCPGRAADDPREQASWFLVEDAIPELPAGADWEIRDHVGIARDTGAAARGIKYDRMVLPRGTVLPLGITLEVPEAFDDQDGERPSDVAERELTALLQALDRGVRFGAARSRGLGLARLCGAPEIRLQDGLLTAAGIKALLRSRIQNGDGLAGTPVLANWRGALSAAIDPTIDIAIHWHPVGPVMVKSGEEGIAVDMLPLVSGSGEAVSLVLPGSALKGALRAHAERILRTVFGERAPAIDDTSEKRAFLDQIGQEELDLARWLFGAPGERKPKTAQAERSCMKFDAAKAPGQGLAALWVDDVYLQQPFARAEWERLANLSKLERTETAPGILDAARPVEAQSGIALDPAMHVAVDRWTGGAAEHQLYSVLEPHAARPNAWEPIRLTLRTDRLPQKLRLPAVALLLLTLRDVARGLVPIGFGGNRGLGAIAIDSVAYGDLASLGTADGAVHPKCADDPCLKAFPGDLLQTIRSAWCEFVGNQAKKEC